MHYVKQFVELSKGDVSIAGGKGASLGEMSQAGIPVPPGFVLLASAFDAFLAETDIGVEIAAMLDTVKTEEMHTVEHASEKLQALILNATMPPKIADEIISSHEQLGAEFVAVRSSATAEDSASAAWAGQLDSFLNTTKETLLQNVQKCWASLFTPRAIFYRFEKKLHTQQVSVAVVVQAMVQSEMSGIAFSVHPVTQDRNQLIIEAGYGLGEAIVSGQVTPDSYVVTKHPLEIIDKNISTQDRMLVCSTDGGNEWISCPPPQEGELEGVVENFVVDTNNTTTSPNPSSRGGESNTISQKLSDSQILELAQLIIKIENHYGFPCDIEWAWVSRPAIPASAKAAADKPDSTIDAGTSDEALAKSEGNPESSIGQFYITQSRPITTLQPGKDNLVPTHEAPIFMVNRQSREHSIAYLYVWQRSNQEFSSWYFDTFKHLLFIYRGGDSKTEAWYEERELDACYEQCADRAMNNPEYLRLVEESFWQHLNMLLPYVEGGESFKSLSDLQIFFEHWIAWWTPMAVLFVLPQSKTATDEIKREALAIRTKTEKYSDVLDEIFINGFKKLRPDCTERANYMTPEEIFSAAEFLTVDTQAIVQRTHGFVHYNGRLYNLNELPCLLAENNLVLQIPHAEEDDSVRGEIGFSGITRGMVIVVRTKKDLAKVVSGAVLVTGMTSPDYVPYFKLAAACVTDEGGVVCHAAIVARELGKPCIVGTKIATQVLHDGDLVEVDASNGVVRILEKAK